MKGVMVNDIFLAAPLDLRGLVTAERLTDALCYAA
jgi:hypothetical protein